MDFDTTRQKGGYERILEAFSKKQADILVGTQMIVKGHDFPGVTLVGALAADLSLYAGDYRAAERTFQLLVQAAGRAGRGTTPGTAIIQTYSPDHYSIETAADQDYKAFFEKEMAFRRMMNYPPAAHLMALYLMSEDEEALNRGAVRLKALAMSHTRQEIALIGPSDAGLSKLKDVYRKVLYLKCTEMNYLTEWKGWLEAVLPKEKQLSTFNIQFDMDPVNPF